MRYGFGKNWEEFVQREFSETRVQAAQKHMLRVLKRSSLEGLSFLDIGSGSGLHSLAAFRAGASRIVSFDYDEDSVRTTRLLHERAGRPAHWSVGQGSVLDPTYMRALEPADIVYSWGVLHHTGEMWKAIENAALPIAPNGVFYIALYTSDVYTARSPAKWLEIKQRYNRAGPLRKRMMEWGHALHETILPALIRGRNPLTILSGSDQDRGMTYWTDVKDWLGGWPMEFAGISETKRFGNDLGLELLNILAGEANTEYLFRRRGAPNYWDDVVATKPLQTIGGPFEHRKGFAFSCRLDVHAGAGECDIQERPRRSRLMLYEDGIPLGFAHQKLAMIAAHGGGRYVHSNNEIVFSASDGSDPNSNQRLYGVRPDFL
jgi:hypothetical protein